MKINYCPHGYGECQFECAYPGRCGRFVKTDTHSPAPSTTLKQSAMRLYGASKGKTGLKPQKQNHPVDQQCKTLALADTP